MASAIIIILDGVGAGELPDAADYGDVGSDTLGNTARAVGGLTLPMLGRLGLGNLHSIAGVPPAVRPLASWGRMGEVSHGKDSTTGHWELMGVITAVPFPTYPDGFPPVVLERFREAVGREVLGNCVASGTEIIERLGDEHVRTGRPIVYTSADSVFQIAAHEEVVPLARLYAWCEAARQLLVPPHHVSRVIARPFTGGSGHYVRTPNRRDFSVEPPDTLLLPRLVEAGVARDRGRQDLRSLCRQGDHREDCRQGKRAGTAGAGRGLRARRRRRGPLPAQPGGLRHAVGASQRSRGDGRRAGPVRRLADRLAAAAASPATCC